MSAEEIVYAAVSALESIHLPYMIVGSFSSNLYGVPRSTKDADFVAELGDVSPTKVAERLGPGFVLDPQMSFETITGTYRFKAKHVDSAFEIGFFLVSNDAHDRTRFGRRRREPMPEREAYVASPEDVIITKLRWSKGGNRAKDVNDVRNVISLQSKTLDWEYVRRWCAEHGTLELLERVRKEAETLQLPE